MTIQEITLMSTAHNARTLGGIVVERPSECLEAISAGYSVQAIKFTLRKPEYMLSDLSNPPRPISFLSSEEIQMFHSVIQSVLAKESPEIQSKIITGSGLNTEIAIYGDDRESVSRDGRRIQEQALNLFGPENRHQMHTPFLSRGIEKNRGLQNLYPHSKLEYESFCKNLREYYIEDFINYINIFNLSSIYANHMIWPLLRGLGHNFVFILNSGIRFYLSLLNHTGPVPAIFMEIHRQNDAYELFRRKPIDLIEGHGLDLSRPIVILDIAYTGGSIISAKESLLRRYGCGINVITVGVFPKSYEAINRLDYCIYAGRLIRLTGRRFSATNWHNELLFENHANNL